MIPSFDREIRACLAVALGGVFKTAVDERAVRLPARHADASVHVPPETDPAAALAADYGSLWGAPLVSGVRLVNGWLLFAFSDAFCDALVSRVNEALPLPPDDGGAHAVNRMLALGRHEGAGCPAVPAMRRALLEAISARQSPAAFRRASRAAETLFHAVPPRDRPALLCRSGAVGTALAKLLYYR